MAATRTFSDIDLAFTIHPVTGDISRKNDAAAVKAAVKHLIITRNWERLFHSEIGSQVKDSLFELGGPMLSIIVQRSCEDCIRNFEPRVNLDSVDVSYSGDGHTLYVTINFTIINTTQPLSVDVILYRSR